MFNGDKVIGAGQLSVLGRNDGSCRRIIGVENRLHGDPQQAVTRYRLNGVVHRRFHSQGFTKQVEKEIEFSAIK
jgi:hypothetical protein